MKSWYKIWIEIWEDIRGEAQCNWCNATASFMVGRTSRLTEKRYSDPACIKHANEWNILKFHGGDTNSG